ncbi:hypothetical protein OXX69_002929 [Metschnikowia pulcherrima]
MKFLTLPILALVSLANACAAPESKDSPFASVYTAIFDKSTLGAVVFWSLDGYVTVGVALANLPARGGPYTYRIHDKKQPLGGCDNGSKPFNPYCGTFDGQTPAEKEVGDLSGKHGVITGTATAQSYDDDFLSLNTKNRAFIGDLAVVIENSRGQRVACANIEDLTSPLTGEKAKAAEPATKLPNLPKHVADLLV